MRAFVARSPSAMLVALPISLAGTCSFHNEPNGVRYFWDQSCLPHGGAGCYADGVHQECRFCGAKPFPDCSDAPPPPPPTTQCKIEKHNCWGEDLANHLGTSAEQCCDLCSTTAGCNSFTYDMYDEHGARNPTCFLKTGCSNKKESWSAVSGDVYGGSPPAPVPTPPNPSPTPLPNGVSARVVKALGSRGYNKVRVSLVRRSTQVANLTMSESEQLRRTVAGGAVAWSYQSQFQHKWTDNHISSAVVTVEPGQTTTLNLDGHNVNVRIPRQQEGTVGLLIADPCIVQSQWCPHANTFDIKQTLHTVLNSLAEHNELDYWMNIGDLFYDQTGGVTWDFFSGLSPKAASTIHGISVGNHDFWQNGSPGTPRAVDNLGFGLMQFYAQDTISSKFNEGSPFDFRRLPPRIAHGSNFFWYTMMGNIAFISFSGAETWADSQANFEEACRWADTEDPSLVVLLGHWDARNLGCEAGMAAPDVYRELLSMPGCQRFGKRIKYFEGHNHCNEITNPNTGFMFGSFGMSGCGQFGLPILDTRNGKALLYYFPLGNGGARYGPWDVVMGCIKSKGFSACTQYADVWMEQDFAEQSLDFAWANTSGVELI